MIEIKKGSLIKTHYGRMLVVNVSEKDGILSLEGYQIAVQPVRFYTRKPNEVEVFDNQFEKETYKQRVKEAIENLVFKYNAKDKDCFESHEINDWLLDLLKELGLENLSVNSEEKRK